jgi:transcriptional regulator with GAF, ATPase, and Fis domain/tetratricopeptide (TPR) repeat protein
MSIATGCPGRESELGLLTAAAQHITRESLIVLEGPSGIGKSRVLGEFRSRVRLNGGVVLEGRCEPARAFGPFAEIVERSLRFLDEVGQAPRASLEGLRCSMGCHRLWHQHADGELHAMHADDPQGASQETAAFERKMRFFDAVAGLLRDVANIRPPVVLMHNIERADEGTLELLAFLVEGASMSGSALPALFVASDRLDSRMCDRSAERISTLKSMPMATRITLGPLGAEGLKAFLTSDDTIARLLARTGGNPDLLEILLDAEPMTSRRRVERKLRALSTETRRLVDALAVLGRPMAMDALAFVANVSVRGVPDMASELIVRSNVDGEIRYAFDREALRQDAYELIEDAERRSMHARAVELCAKRFEHEDAVRHAISTGNLSLASELALTAAASLSARHAHGEAAALLETLVQATEPSQQIREELTDLHRIAGNYKAALVHAGLLAREAQEDARAAHRLGYLLQVSGDLAGARREFLRALELPTAAHSLRAEIESQLAEVLYQQGDYPAARRSAESALGHEAVQPRIVIQARNILGKLALAQKNPEHAATQFEQNRRDAHAVGLAHPEAQALTNLAITHFLRNDFDAAEDYCKRAIELAIVASDTRDRAIATENLAVLAHLRRDYSNALRHYQSAATLLKRLGNRAMLVRLARNLGDLYLSLGDTERARVFCDQAAHMQGAGTPPPVTAERLVLRGRVETAMGNSEAAKIAFESALEIFQQLSDVRAFDVQLELARVALSDGDVEDAQARVAALPAQDGKRAADAALVRALLAQAEGADAIAAAAIAVTAAEQTEDEEKLLPALTLHARALLDEEEYGRANRVLERAVTTDERLSRTVPEDALAAWNARPVRREIATLTNRLANVGGAREASPRPTVSLERNDRLERRFPAIAGRSAAVQSVLSVIEKVAPHDTIVLIRGESGTGKELVAEAIHHHSTRANKPIVKVNCGALVETLLLSELFGHERGAFTGAQARKKGRFELADGGTIFLDEIGDISAKTQVALLRVLQEREFERVGGTAPIRVDVRIVAATHRDLEKMVREGTFREDLYYRLRGVVVEMPPLRRRLEDLPALSERLLARIATERSETPKRLAPSTIELLAQHKWPGNVRELENVLRSATLFADGEVLEPGDMAAFAQSFVPMETRETDSMRPPADIELQVYERVRQGSTSLFEMKKNLERECIVRALEEMNGNITRAAALLGMKRPRLSQLVKEYELGHLGK